MPQLLTAMFVEQIICKTSESLFVRKLPLRLMSGAKTKMRKEKVYHKVTSSSPSLIFSNFQEFNC